MDIIPDKDFYEIFALFSREAPESLETVSTSRGEQDFRETVIVTTAAGGRLVIKLADNDFTDPGRISVWRRCAAEYRALGYYVPEIFTALDGTFPRVSYKGRSCCAYAEEFAPYTPLEDRAKGEETAPADADLEAIRRDIWTMTARVAAKHFDFSEHPSAYCLFETFCPSDKTDEVLEAAGDWLSFAQGLAPEFQPRVQRIWQLWTENRAALEPLYKKLPTSVFQADLNDSNLLLDESGHFVGIYDLNLCGREVFLNYLFRENFAGDFDKELEKLFSALTIAREHYSFSEEEKRAALPLYRCLKPLWFNKLEGLKECGDSDAVSRFLDRTEQALTEDIDFEKHM
ncbi:MAG: hypothetical protein IJ746_00355 [Ruminococcus sp.]|nr:hypothetical protein [Ruminococcus sp.]